MAVDDPVLITCAISGAVVGKAQCPAIPYTPHEYAAEARRAVDEGATMIHIHARTPAGEPSSAIEDFRAITEAITADVEVVVTARRGRSASPSSTGSPVSCVMGALGGAPATARSLAAIVDHVPHGSHWV